MLVCYFSLLDFQIKLLSLPQLFVTRFIGCHAVSSTSLHLKTDCHTQHIEGAAVLSGLIPVCMGKGHQEGCNRRAF